MRQAVQYLSPRTLAEALELLHTHAGCCKPYAGGTDLMVQLRDGAAKTAAVQYLMDLQHLPELFGIQKNADFITVGAMETHAPGPGGIPGWLSPGAQPGNRRRQCCQRLGGS